MFVTLIAMALAGVPDPPPIQPFALRHERAVGSLCFPSGLRVTVIEDTRQPVVSVTTIVDRGSASDPLGREGAAHLIEHLWFRASPGGVPVSHQLDDLGAQHNAFTARDTTVYITVADENALPGILELEAARLQDVLEGVDEDVLAEERALVESELDLNGFVAEDIVRLLPDLRTGETALLPRNSASIRSLDRSVLEEVAASYTPANTTIQLTGPLRPRVVREMLASVFPRELLLDPRPDAVPGGEDCPVRRSSADPTPPTDRPDASIGVIEANVTTPIWVAGFLLPPSYSRHEPVGRMATLWLGEHLDHSLSERRFDDVERDCMYVPGVERAAAVCWATLPDGVNGNEVRARFMDQQAMLKSLRADAGPLNDVARLEPVRVVLSLDSTSTLHNDDALYDALSNHFSGDPSWHNDALSGYLGAPHERVAKVAVNWLRPEQASETVLLRPGQTLTEAMSGAGGATESASDEYSPDESDDPRELDDSEFASHHPRVRSSGGPAPIEPSVPRLAEPVVTHLSTGLEVIVVPHGQTPIVQMALMSHGGRLTEERLGLDAWATAHSSSVPTNLAITRYEDRPSQFMSQKWVWDRQDAHVVGFSGVTATLDGQLWSLAHYANYRHSADYVAHHQEHMANTRQTVRNLHERPWVLADEAKRRHLLGADHPLTPNASRVMLAGGRIAPAAVRRYVRRQWNPGNATLIVVGDVDPEEVVKKVEYWFGQWRGRKGPNRVTLPSSAPMPTRRRAFVTTSEDADGAEFDVSCRVSSDSRAVGEVGEEWSRELLWAHLRESGVSSYNPQSAQYEAGNASVLNLSATVGFDRVQLAATAFDALLSDLSEGPSDTDVQRIARRLQARWPQRYMDNLDVLAATLEDGAAVREVALQGQQALGEVTAAEVRAWASSCSEGAVLHTFGHDADALDGTPWEESLVSLNALDF